MAILQSAATSAAVELGRWVLARYPYDDRLYGASITHLKLQKLCFYAAGAAVGHLGPDAIEGLAFEAWDHGPVLRDLWLEHRGAGSRPLPRDAGPVNDYGPEVEGHLRDALTVYGLLSAWSLRQQSHLEAPWVEASASPSKAIPTTAIAQHFGQVWKRGRVRLPAYLTDAGSFFLDSLPTGGFRSLSELAGALRDALPS